MGDKGGEWVKRVGMGGNGEEWWRMVRNGLEWVGMVENRREWSVMRGNG